MTVINLAGQRFGRLVAVSLAPNRGRDRTWVCVCDCGNQVEVRRGHLRSGHTTSCGCLHQETLKAGAAATHRATKTRLYRIWAAMKRRCYNPNCQAFKYYGASGVTVCERWRGSFANFAADMGEVPEGTQIDRFPNQAGNYEPGNCRWATRKEQMNNQSGNRLVTHEGETLTVQQWSDRTGIPAQRIYKRLTKLEMPPAIALSPGKRSRKGMARRAPTWQKVPVA
jgi:hypothetical protein